MTYKKCRQLIASCAGSGSIFWPIEQGGHTQCSVAMVPFSGCSSSLPHVYFGFSLRRQLILGLPIDFASFLMTLLKFLSD